MTCGSREFHNNLQQVAFIYDDLIYCVLIRDIPRDFGFDAARTKLTEN